MAHASDLGLDGQLLDLFAEHCPLDNGRDPETGCPIIDIDAVSARLGTVFGVLYVTLPEGDQPAARDFLDRAIAAGIQAARTGELVALVTGERVH